MYATLANLVHRGRWVVVASAVAFAVLSGYLGGPAASLMTNDNDAFQGPTSENAAAEERLADATGANPGAAA
jgi:uncharacterized membrane protein YdfJ with MMPL/SSD domain